MPRPSRGSRHPFMTRFPQHLADQVIAEAESRGLSYSEYIALRVAEAHGEDVMLPPKLKPTPVQMSTDDLEREERNSRISA